MHLHYCFSRVGLILCAHRIERSADSAAGHGKETQVSTTEDLSFNGLLRHARRVLASYDRNVDYWEELDATRAALIRQFVDLAEPIRDKDWD